jgi:hypothetical protein
MAANDYYLPVYKITPEEIFANQIYTFDINFFEPKANVDIKKEVLLEKLKNSAPGGITVCDVVYDNVPDFREVAKAEFVVKVYSDVSKNEFNSFLSLDSILTEKKTKKGISEIDLKPMIEIVEMKDGFIRMRLPSGTQTNINANLVFEAFEKQFDMEIDTLNIKRTAVYCQNGEIFR